MKHLFILVFGTVFSLASMATSIQITKLEYLKQPLEFAADRIDTDRIIVRLTGEVDGYRFNPKGELILKKSLGKIDAIRMQQIDLLIDRTRKADTVSPGLLQFHCMALPTQRESYFAEGQRIMLETRTAPCGGSSYNDTRSSLELVNLLNSYVIQFNKN